MRGQKTGGRQKGTPNKATAFSKSVIQDIVSNYVLAEKDSDNEFNKTFIEDFGKLDPKDRIDVIIKLAAFITPKPQTVAINFGEEKKDTFGEKLARLAQENE
jgi:hypothetical protein